MNNLRHELESDIAYLQDKINSLEWYKTYYERYPNTEVLTDNMPPRESINPLIDRYTRILCIVMKEHRAYLHQIKEL